MCGICGVIRSDGAPVDVGALVAMRERMSHRGPDDRGAVLLPLSGAEGASGPGATFFVEPEELAGRRMACSVGLAHRRLSIIDLSERARQPMSDLTGRYWIVYNGEVYDFRELRGELEREGCRFKSTSKTCRSSVPSSGRFSIAISYSSA